MTKMVTRTINGTKVMARVYDNETEEMRDVEVVVNGTYPSDEKKVKKFNESVEKSLGDGLKLVKIMEAEAVSNLYGMPETDFIAHAKIIEKNKAEN